MSKGLHTQKLDFEILPNSNEKVLLFLDASEYFEQPESPLLKVVPPGFKKFFTVNIDFGKINILSSNTLGWTDILEDDTRLTLPDGIWKFTYMICPYNYLYVTKAVLRTTSIDESIRDIYCMVDVDCEETCFKTELLDIHLMLESAKANCEEGNIEKAAKDFSITQKKVRAILEKLSTK